MDKPFVIRHRVTMPRKAIVLAAGFGTRMEPLSWDLPKPMMPLFGIPLLEHTLQSLAEWGVREVLINLHHAPDEILSWFRQRPQGGLSVVFSFEPKILGTGGALRRAHFFVAGEPCWLVNGDIAFVLDPHPLVQLFRRHHPPAVLWLDAVRGPRTVACDGRGVITDFAVAQPGAEGTYTYCGIQLFHPALLDALPASAFCSVIDACRNVMGAGHPVYGCVSKGAYWADMGTPAQYLAGHAEAPVVLRARGRRNCHKGAVLWQGAKVVAGGAVARSIIGRNVHVETKVEDACVVRSDVAGMDPVVTGVLRALRMKAAETLYIQLPRRGSDRAFVRLVSPKRSVVLIRYRADRRPENGRYGGHAAFLAGQGIPVPRVLLSDRAQNLLVLEDMGEQALQFVPRGARDAWYRRVVRHVARLHAIPLSACPELEVGFDADLYAWEHALFVDAYLARYHRIGRSQRTRVLQALGVVAAKLAKLPSVLLHRDLQSSNILLHRNRPVLIDFQGMRAGPAVYDLASLLYDPYVALTTREQQDYLCWYLRGADRGHAEMIRCMLPLAGIQRLAQALGAFGRLEAKAGTERFGVYVPVARGALLGLLQQTGACPDLVGLLVEKGTDRDVRI